MLDPKAILEVSAPLSEWLKVYAIMGRMVDSGKDTIWNTLADIFEPHVPRGYYAQHIGVLTPEKLLIVRDYREELEEDFFPEFRRKREKELKRKDLEELLIQVAGLQEKIRILEEQISE